jgi:hypothetical protein
MRDWTHGTVGVESQLAMNYYYFSRYNLYHIQSLLKLVPADSDVMLGRPKDRQIPLRLVPQIDSLLVLNDNIDDSQVPTKILEHF